jgi:hypothetical protein
MEMRISTEKRDRLALLMDMLNALSAMASHDGSPMLRYFVELAAAQARDEHAALTKAIAVDSATQAHMVVH